ncbi:APC family permease [Rhizobium sp. 2MFCol3.1]|uniref:APC family permease n=1 Tax=Rhizobium sp. 2MFCol3.1 TaxID=1246459 RepID=UPI00036621CA|nr:APC family permease [Rhizobium sp. 2MFCol3.1]
MTSTSVEAFSENVVERSLTTSKVISLILAILTPLSCLIALVPLGLAFGGPSMPLTYLFVAVILGIFCVGYVEMARRITRPGAAYSYIARGLGRPVGAGIAFVTVAGAVLGAVAAFVTVASVVSSILQIYGVLVPWTWVFCFEIVLGLVLTWFNIDFNARIMRVVIAIELLTFAVLAGAIVAAKGLDAFPMSVLSFNILSSGHWQVAFIFAILCFQGFESGALYGPEAIKPEKTIPRALIGVVAILTIAFFFETWAFLAVTGTEDPMTVILSNDPRMFVFNIASEYLGLAGSVLFSIIVMFGALAASVAAANYATRYLSSVAQDSLLPSFLALENRNRSPIGAYCAVLVLTIFTGIITAAYNLDAYTQVGSLLFGLSALAITITQFFASFAVIGYFRRNGEADVSQVKTQLAPAIAAVLLAGALAIELTSLEWVTGSSESWAVYLPLAFVALFIAGCGFTLWLKANRADVYQGLAAGDTAEEAAAIRERRLNMALTT